MASNNVQANPSNAAHDFDGWPDWNSAKGVGKPAENERSDAGVFDEIYANQRSGADELEAQRLAEIEASTKPRQAAEVTDAHRKAKRRSE
jgi:hypothetical protein